MVNGLAPLSRGFAKFVVSFVLPFSVFSLCAKQYLYLCLLFYHLSLFVTTVAWQSSLLLRHVKNKTRFIL